MAETAPDEVVVNDRVVPSAWVCLGISLAILAASPFLLAASGTGETEWLYRNVGGYLVEREGPAWVATLCGLIALIGTPALYAGLMLRRLAAVRVDAERILLHGKGKPQAKWDELDRVVLWRRRVRRLGFIPGWKPQVGLVRDSERNRNFEHTAAGREWSRSDLRGNGVPEWLPGGIQKQSRRLSARSGPELAAAVARFAPRVRVVDQTAPGRARTVEPGS